MVDSALFAIRELMDADKDVCSTDKMLVGD